LIYLYYVEISNYRIISCNIWWNYSFNSYYKIFAVKKIKKFIKKAWFWILLFTIAFFIGMFANATYAPNFALPPWMQTKAPHGPTPALPMGKIIQFFTSINKMERVDDIGANPNHVPPPIARNEPALVKIDITAQEVISEVAPGIFFN